MTVVNLFNPAEGGRTVSVNGVEISATAIAEEMKNYDAEDLQAAWQQAATALTLKQLLLQQAQAEQLQGEEEAQIEALLSRHVQVPVADEDDCLRYFSSNSEKFYSPTLIEARHILLAASLDSESRAQARFEAARLIHELSDDVTKFAEYAQTYSACPSREYGGNLGQISKGTTVPEFETPLFKLTPGLAQQPIETRYGFHVVWLENKVDGQALPYDQVKQGIARYLEDTAFRRGVSHYLQLLAGRAVIKGITLSGA